MTPVPSRPGGLAVRGRPQLPVLTHVRQEGVRPEGVCDGSKPMAPEAEVCVLAEKQDFKCMGPEATLWKALLIRSVEGFPLSSK